MINWRSLSLKELVYIVSGAFKRAGIETPVICGAYVSVSSLYRSSFYDLDFTNDDQVKKIKLVIEGLGFKNQGAYFQKNDCRWLIEFVPLPSALKTNGNSSTNNQDNILETLRVLSPEDFVKDHLTKYFQSQNAESFQKAVSICHSHPVDLSEIKRWSITEIGEAKTKKLLLVLEDNSDPYN